MTEKEKFELLKKALHGAADLILEAGRVGLFNDGDFPLTELALRYGSLATEFAYHKARNDEGKHTWMNQSCNSSPSTT
jgi:hypothetical protein